MRVVRALVRHRPSITVGLILFLVINGLSLVLYLWSRGGQSTHVVLEARGNSYKAYVDGQLAAAASFETSPNGSVVLTLFGGQENPSLPEPRGIASIRVTDLASGALLVDDAHALSGRGSDWTVLGGEYDNAGGAISAGRSGVRIGLGSSDWRDYAVDLVLRNETAAELTVRSDGQGSGVTYDVAPFWIGTSQLRLVNRSATVQSIDGPKLRLKRSEVLKSMAAMILRPYPYLALLVLVGCAGAAAVSLLPARRLRHALPASAPGWAPVDPVIVIASALAILLFGVTQFFSAHYLAHMPHIPDELSYLFEAKLLATGHVVAPAPRVVDVFDYFYPPYIIQLDGHWGSAYPFGHPLMLAVGALVGAVWLVPSLLGAASVVLLAAIGRRLYGARVALVACVLMVTSPFVLMMSSSYMSHTSAMFYVVASLFFLTMIDRRPLVYGMLAGVFFGLLFNTRPLTAFALMPPFGLLLATFVARRERRLLGLKEVAAFVAGGLLLLVGFLLYNYATTGDPLMPGYRAALPPAPGVVVDCAKSPCVNLSEGVGFGGRHTLGAGIQNEQTQLAMLLLVLNGWPQYAGLGFVLLPFLLATRRWWDWFLLSSAACIMGAWIFFEGTGIAYGPRYWYEAVPFLMLLTARGAESAGEFLWQVAARFRRACHRDSAPGVRWAGALAAHLVLAALIGTGLYTWLLGRQPAWRGIPFVPERAASLRSFNNVDDRLVRLIDGADLHNALVLVELCPDWQCYGNVFWKNSPQLDGDVVFAKDVPALRAAIFAAYPDRMVYIAQYAPQPALSPFGGTAVGLGLPLPPGPVARTIPPSSPTPLPTEDPARIAVRDDKRRNDLAIIAGALQQYRQRHGTYPATPTTQTLCVISAIDAGCTLRELLNPIPTDLQGRVYWYASDGQTFTLWASFEAPPASACDDRPQLLSGVVNLYCVTGDASSAP